MAEPILKVENISIDLVRQGQTTPILRDVSFDLSERQTLGIIGESGSGKTVLSRAVIGAINPPLFVTSGRVIYRGQELTGQNQSKIEALRGREIGYIGNNPGSALDPTIAVGHQIVEKLRAVEPGISKKEAKDRTIAMLKAVRLPRPEERFHEFPFQYSGGMMQRALIVDALVTNPAFVIADNVTQPLDVTIAAQIIRLMHELREEFNTAIIFVSSSLAVVREIADDIIVLNDGVIVERNSSDKIVNAPAGEYTKQLLTQIPRIWETEETFVPEEAVRDEKVILRVEDIYKTYSVKDPNRFFGYNAVEAVRGVTFDVHAGENFGIVGESGCGKSTLSRLLSWVEKPEKGTIHFEDADLSKLKGRELIGLRRRFQLLLQDPYNALPPHMPVGRTIAEPLIIHGGLSRNEIRDRVRAVMVEVGLPDSIYGDLLVGLSAGQRQRINLARALVLEPQLLILDETLSALDQVEQSRLLETFERLQQEHGFTYIFISHDLAMVRRACTRIAVMYLGKVVELADNHSVFFDPGHPYTRALLSAVPTIEERRYDAKECLLEGEPPSPIGIPPGCSFMARCPLAMQHCVQNEPPLEARKQGVSACFRANASDQELVEAARENQELRKKLFGDQHI
ncbi:MAG: ABC transporter ATP-binding protein [Rhodospirillaceae bacterium]|nr:ABC transporter ATP-binding protein [Rhodospirillaceae bacterium]MBT5039215.1 ABC transporter ATP-binding protein [Rhodospirillaceae bacterium]MBT7291633.1 ABC transporter ATP-binding protein [Rhodospirillaceae bacterium]